MAEIVRLDEATRELTELKLIKQPWLSLFQDITDYVLPRRSFWDIEAPEGGTPTVKRYDGTALNALQQMTDGLIGWIFSPKSGWFRLVTALSRLMKEPGTADWLEECEESMYSDFDRSNLGQAMPELVMDAGSVGTGVMLMEDDLDENVTLFSVRHLKECYIAENRAGHVDTLYRLFKIENRKAVEAWGDKLSKARLQQAHEHPFLRFKCLHRVAPRRARDQRYTDAGNKPWSSSYYDMDLGTVGGKDAPVSESGFDTFPYLVWRWRKNTDESYGRSPASDAIQEILRLNQLSRSSTLAAQLAVQPPLNVPEGMRGMEKLLPWGKNYYSDPNRMISTIQMGDGYPWGKEEEQRLMTQIQNVFRVKLFSLLNELEASNKTATEVREIVGERAAALINIVGTMETEILRPMIQRQYQFALRSGRMPPPPQSLVDSGALLKVEFQGPLAQAMKRYHENQGVRTGLEFIGGMQPMFPETLDWVDGDELMRTGLDSSGVAQRIIREAPDVQILRKIRQAAQEQEEKQAVALEREKTLAPNFDKLNKPLNPEGLAAQLAKAGGAGKEGVA